ncbi:acetate--CoA ligase family protein [Microvirga sp. M2]|uniref:acetate--CoA ligase family protein n=1 Tax=Microvirga sp. M2 TaxID=3073270 RepID=UPI0039C06584
MILAPQSVAVIGASEDLTKFGGRIYKNLVHHGFKGQIYPINPKREQLLGIKCYPAIGATPTPPDMAVMAVPRDAVKEAVAACAAAGTKAAIVITSKFSDAGPEGAALEREMVSVANAAGMRIIGPNCLGIISPANDLVLCASPALFVDSMPKGDIGFVSQSGALMATIFDRAMARGIGFSHCFSIGNQADMDMCDFVDYLIADERTHVICTYVEGIKDARRFMETARRAYAAGKPWLAVKAGRTEFGAAAAFSHTASLAGSYEAFAAACRDCGVLTMDDPDAMMLLAASLGRFPKARPNSVAIVTTSGGGGAIAADRLTDRAIPLASFSDAAKADLAEHYADNVAGANPIDMGTAKQGGSMVVGGVTIKTVIKDTATDLILSAITTAPDVELLCRKLDEGTKEAAAEGFSKPHILVLQQGHSADAARAFLRREGIVYTDSLDDAIRAIEAWRRMADAAPTEPPARPAGVPDDALTADLKGSVGEADTKAILAAHRISTNRGEVVSGPEQAEAMAAKLEKPFVVKVVSPDIVHKSDVGGVVLGLETPQAVASAVSAMASSIARLKPDAKIEGYLVQEMRSGKAELLIGARNDPQFGPMVIVGAGGVLVELLKDVSVALAPVSPAKARTMIESLQIAKLMRGFRGGAVLDIEAAADIISRVSWMAHDIGPRFKELDINPLLVGEAGKGCVAVDGRMLLEDD